MNPFLKIKQKVPKVLFPQLLEHSTYGGKLLGYYHKNTSVYNIVGTDDIQNDSTKKINQIGEIIDRHVYNRLGFIKEEYYSNLKITYKPNLETDQILAIREHNVITFYTNEGIKCESESYTLINDVFSRNTGILETTLMLDKTAIISGCGSVGSLVALELARSGVGKFLLIDNDIISYHNICRHQCGIEDVGKYKVDAVEERILQINPTAKIRKSTTIIEEVPETIFKEFCDPYTIIIGCADNREGDLYANLISKLYKVPFLSIGFWERAFAGEIFYTLPNGMPCYKCFYDEIGVAIERPAFRKFYTNEQHLEKLNFEPGISVDINFVTTIAIKLAIDILNIENTDYIPKIINHLDQYTLVCNTNDERIGGEQARYFSYPLQIRKGIDVNFGNGCSENESCRLLNKELP